jgi:hypothetical protein
MTAVSDHISAEFYRWEQRGRGYQVFDCPVSPEPPFRPFLGYHPPAPSFVDDGRRATVLSSLVERLSNKLSGQIPAPPVIPKAEEEPEPEAQWRESLVELQTRLPGDFDLPKGAFEQFLGNLALCREPLSFELLGTEGEVLLQFASHPKDAPVIRRQLEAHFPEASFHPREGTLINAWNGCEGEEALVVELGLAHEFMLPLAVTKIDPYIGIIGALSELRPGELALFQVIFQSAANPWAESILRSVSFPNGSPLFVNAPELLPAAKVKTARPLYAAVVRIAIQTRQHERTLELARDLAASLRVFANPQGNELIPLQNVDYPFEDHIEDMLRRQSRRSGMLLNCDELAGFVHLPGSAVLSPLLKRDTGNSRRAPESVRGENGVLLGNNPHAEEFVPVHLTPDQRVRHTHIIGVHGTGKSTLLFNLIRQDIEQGEGLAVLEPHGDLIEQVLGIIPPERIDDVILVDPSDEGYSVPFNILSAHSDLEKNLLASDLVSIFQRLSTSWGDQMGSVLQNAILAFLESERGGTLADLRRFLIEPAFRAEFLKSVRDPDIVYYWQKGFTQLTGNKSIGPVITRLETFLSPKPIRYMVSQTVNRLDFREILDTGKIFLAKLPQGQMGKENAFLLGSLLVSKFQQLAMGRQAQRVSLRKDFWLYIDEFQNFITPSMSEILTGARKYRLGLILAHQELRQLERDREVASAVLSNPYTRVVFRVGDADARSLESGFSHFEARDLQNLETGQAICRVEKADGDFNLTVPIPNDLDSRQMEARSQAVIAASRAKYATPRAEVEKALLSKAEIAPQAKSTPPPLPNEPKLLEVPKPTVSEKERVFDAPTVTQAQVPSTVLEAPPKPAVANVPHEPLPPRDLGRGGEQHKTIQERLQAEAHALGFHAEVEGRVSDESTRAADLILRRGEMSIAVEIAVTTTTDHEFGNVKKCLAAGFNRVAVVSPRQERLEQIARAVTAGLGSEAAAKVSFHLPDGFIAELRALAAEEMAKPPPPVIPNVRTTRGYKVRRQAGNLSFEERKAKEHAAVQMLAEAMKRKK